MDADAERVKHQEILRGLSTDVIVRVTVMFRSGLGLGLALRLEITW